MIVTTNVMDEFNKLNEEHKEEVLDFIYFLKQKENNEVIRLSEEVFAEYDEVFRELARYSYMSTSDGIEMSYTDLKEVNIIDYMVVDVKDTNTNSCASVILPNLVILSSNGFTDRQLMSVVEMVKRHEILLWDLARGSIQR